MRRLPTGGAATLVCGLLSAAGCLGKGKACRGCERVQILRVNNKPMFLGELESKIAAMQLLGIRADKKTKSATIGAQ